MPNLSLEHLNSLARKALIAAGTSEENARIVAEALVAAEADGLASHGMSRLPSYADQVKSGKVDGKVTPVVNQTGTASVCVDARSGFAFPAIAAGLDKAAEIITETGVVAVSVGNSHHSGAAGYHVERMAEKGLVTIAFSNSPAGIAPWGGTKAVFGTNPVAFACPRKGQPPLVIDLSLAKVARGKIKMAADKGESIPEGWAVDGDGNPTTDAKAAMQGTNLPMGDAKGYALVLMVEILAAVLTGSNCGFEASSFFAAEGEPPHVGQFFIVLNPKAFAGEGFSDRLEVLLSATLEHPNTRLPGSRRTQIRNKSVASGIDLPEALHGDLLNRINPS